MNELKAGSKSRAKVLKGWVLLIGMLLLYAAFFLWTDGRRPPNPRVHEHAEGAFAILGRIFVGLVALGLGAGAYTAVILTRCFTFNFHQPIWPGLKTRLYLANIIIPVIFMVAAGLILSAFLIPLLQAAGFSRNMASTIPIIVSVVVLQIALVWVNIWAQLAKPLDRLRLKAKGLTEDQLARGICIGISDPSRKSSQRWAFVEEDLGMLWLDDHRLVYFGDNQHFSFSPSEVVGFGCELDGGSSTVLAAIAHPVLRVRQEDGTERRIRLHAEGEWSMTARRVANNRLAASIQNWLAKAHEVPLQQAA